MTSYWDEWGIIITKIERGEKVDANKFFYAVAELLSELHDFDHQNEEQVARHLKNKNRLEELRKAMIE